MATTWKHYHELRPDELADCLETSPVAFWPLGLLEHHGWHLPVGFDGIKAERMCIRIAEQTGGVMLPTMWWGAGGGHGDFLWTHYQPPEATASILENTTRQLIAYGFRVIVLMAGHYPWQGILDQHLPDIQADHEDVLLLWGTEVSICGNDLSLSGDHAAKEETSYGLALFPEFVNQTAMQSGRKASDSWPKRQMPPPDKRHPGVEFDANHPLFAQMGEDARLATAEHGEAGITQLVENLSRKIRAYIE